MHNQSDYGYSVPQIERRTKELCERRAAFCTEFAEGEYQAGRLSNGKMYREWAAEWRREAIIYKDFHDER